jgi:hypothetical protein
VLRMRLGEMLHDAGFGRQRVARGFSLAAAGAAGGRGARSVASALEAGTGFAQAVQPADANADIVFRNGPAYTVNGGQTAHCHRRLVAEYLKNKWGDVEIELD